MAPTDTREQLTDILENYAQVIKTRDNKSKKKKSVRIWPRYHQLDVVRSLLDDLEVFDSILVVTDRRILDRQIRGRSDQPGHGVQEAAARILTEVPGTTSAGSTGSWSPRSCCPTSTLGQFSRGNAPG